MTGVVCTYNPKCRRFFSPWAATGSEVSGKWKAKRRCLTSATIFSLCVTSTTCCTTSSCAACVPRAAAAPAAQLLSSRSAALLRCRVVHALRLPMAHCALLIALLISPSPSRRTQQTHDSISDDGSRTQGEQGTNLGTEHKRRVELHAQRGGGGHLQLGTRGALTLSRQEDSTLPEACTHRDVPDCPARPQHTPRLHPSSRVVSGRGAVL